MVPCGVVTRPRRARVVESFFIRSNFSMVIDTLRRMKSGMLQVEIAFCQEIQRTQLNRQCFPYRVDTLADT